MARKRMVSPELLTSESLASLDVATRYAFVALWMYVDDYGRGKDNPALIRAHTWPLDDEVTTEAVDDQLKQLVNVGSVCRYERNGGVYLHIPAWTTFQKVSHPTASRIPECPGERYRKGHEAFVRDSRADREQLRLDQFSSDQCSEGDEERTAREQALAELRSKLHGSSA